MKYKLLKDLPGAKAGAEIVWELGIGYTIEGVQISFGSENILANPDWFAPIDSTCEKCGETEGTELCPKCGAESYGNCPCKPKEEKIEIKLPNLNIKLPREILDPDSGHTEEFRHWAVQMTTSVNKLNGDN